MLSTSLPVAELHRHLDGSVRPSTIWALANEHGISLPVASEQALRELAIIQHRTSDLLEFIQKLEYGVSVLADADACRRVAFESVEDAASEGINYIEMRFSPYFMARSFSLPMEAVVEAVLEGMQDAAQQFGINTGAIGILSRSFGVAACERELNAILTQRDRFCGIDLAGDEAGYPARLFIALFRRARDAGLNITVHAGEAAGPESIWDAVKLLGASRIGHGVAAIHDPILMDYLARHEIGIESCPTSNYQTGAMTDTANHPLRKFLAQGLAVTLNTDDPGISDITLAHEYQVAADVIGLDEKDLQTIQENALKQAFMSDSEKVRWREIFR
ncbi:adenosine deaminase [Alteromonas sp. H39]|uniref:adenosine deaminase n=1 Tax=Alteromonas sp. H39 TaxID=3389876 RepID=UPI0039E1FBED